MITIFECETEIGRCEPERLDGGFDGPAEDCRVYAHTIASLNATKRVLKIEQRCFLRAGEEVPEQPWIKPEVILATEMSSEPQMVAYAQKAHEQYVLKARAQLPETLKD